MKWFWIALGKYFDRRNGIVREKPIPHIHFTKADKPIREMTKDERRELAKKIVEGFLAQQRDEK